MEKLLTQVGERLDRGDLHALQDLVYEYLDRFMGGVLGPGSGVLTAPMASFLPFSRVGIGEALLLTTVPGGVAGRLPTGRLVRHDPNLAGQVSEVDLSGFVGVPTFIWARAVTGPMDSDTRRAWDIDAQDEMIVSMTTRLRERVEWSAGHSKPVGDGWFQVARVKGWAGPTPNIVWIHAWDRTTDGESNATQARALFTSAESDNLVWFGLGAILKAGIRALARHHDTAESVPWYKAPPRGLKQVDAALTRLEASRCLSLTDGFLSHDTLPGAFKDGIAGRWLHIAEDHTLGTFFVAISEPAGRSLASVSVTALIGYIGDDPLEPSNDDVIRVRLVEETVSDTINPISEWVEWRGAEDGGQVVTKVLTPTSPFTFIERRLWLNVLMQAGNPNLIPGDPPQAVLRINRAVANFGD